jgi:integrase
LTTGQEAKLLEALADERFDRLYPVVTVALQTGMRKGELLKLEWRDVDFNLKSIRVRKENNKTGRERFVPMSETCFLVLFVLSLDRKHKRYSVFRALIAPGMQHSKSPVSRISTFTISDTRRRPDLPPRALMDF